MFSEIVFDFIFAKQIINSSSVCECSEISAISGTKMMMAAVVAKHWIDSHEQRNSSEINHPHHCRRHTWRKKTRLNEKSIKTENGVRRRRFVASLYQIVWNSEFRYVPLNEVKRNFKIKAKTFDKFERFLWIVKWHWYWCWYFLNRFVCICKISSCFVTTNFWIRDESICIIAVAVVVVVVHHRIHHCRRGLGLHHRLEEIVHRCWHRHRVHCPKHVH